MVTVLLDRVSLYPDEGVICLQLNVITLYIFQQYVL